MQGGMSAAYEATVDRTIWGRKINEDQTSRGRRDARVHHLRVHRRCPARAVSLGWGGDGDRADRAGHPEPVHTQLHAQPGLAAEDGEGRLREETSECHDQSLASAV